MIDEINVDEITKKHDIDFWVGYLESILEMRKNDYEDFGEVNKDTEKGNKIKKAIKLLTLKML